MIRSGLLALALAGPAAAEGLAGQALCGAVWAKVSAGLAGYGQVNGAVVGQDGDWCLVEAPVLDQPGEFAVDLHLDRLRFRGSALGWIADGSAPPEGLEIVVEGLRVVIQTGNSQMDWLMAAQSRPNRIDAQMALAWDPGARELRLEGLSIDFPGKNLLEAAALMRGVDLSSQGAMEMSVTSFALTEADLHLQTHGFFEWYMLMGLGAAVLPPEGDMETAAAAARAKMTAQVNELPDATVSVQSKAALAALIAELPNPAGDLTVALRSDRGIGPSRLGGYAMTGVPGSVSEAAALFEGVVVDIGWTHDDAS